MLILVCLLIWEHFQSHGDIHVYKFKTSHMVYFIFLTKSVYHLASLLTWPPPGPWLLRLVVLGTLDCEGENNTRYLVTAIEPFAAAAAKSLQSCLTLCDPIDNSPPGSPIPGILQARTLEWVAISFSNAWKWKVKVKSLSRIRPSATPWTTAYQAPPSMGFSRQEYWSGVPLPSPSGVLLKVKKIKKTN